MPVYNVADFVGQAIKSVQAQSFDDWELIAVDDGSADNSAALVAAIAAQDRRVRLLPSIGNQGPGPTRNRAIDAAQGRYIAFLDADDLWHPQKLARQIELMQNTGAALSFTAYIRHNMATGLQTVIGVPARVTRQALLRTNVMGCSTVIYDSAYFGPRQMPNLKRRQDFAFWLSLLADVPFAVGLPLALTTYHQRAVSVSSSKSAAARSTWTLYRGHLGLGRPMAAWVYANYLWRGVLRHRFPGLARQLGVLHSAKRPEDL